MKTFFVAFALGLLVGSLMTAYFSSPEAYAQLKQTRDELLGRETLEPDAPAIAEIDTTAIEAPDPNGRSAAEPVPAPVQSPSEPEPASNPDTDEPIEPDPADPIESRAEPSEATPDPGPPSSPSPQSEPMSSPAEAPVVDDPAPAANPSPKPSPSGPLPPSTQAAVERGAAAAADVARSVKAKASALADEAKPYFDQSIDIAIAGAIRAQFKLEDRIDSDAIRIEVKDRQVKLSGAVASAEVQQLAIAIAATTKGVDEVTHALEIAP